MKKLSSMFLAATLTAHFALVGSSAIASQTPGNMAPSIAALSISHAPFVPVEETASQGRGPLLAFGCDGGQCSCHGDADCNDMYSGGACKTTGSCETAGGVTCTCGTKAKVQSSSGGGKVKIPPVLVKREKLLKKKPATQEAH